MIGYGLNICVAGRLNSKIPYSIAQERSSQKDTYSTVLATQAHPLATPNSDRESSHGL